MPDLLGEGHGGGMSDSEQKTAHVICLNDRIECVVVDTLKNAKERMAKAISFHRDNNFWGTGISDSDYNSRHYWHIRTVPVVGAEVTSGRDTLEALQKIVAFHEADFNKLSGSEINAMCDEAIAAAKAAFTKATGDSK